MIVRSLVSIAVLCCLIPSAQGKDSPHFPGQKQFSVSYDSAENGGAGKVRLRTQGLPEKTVVLLKLQLDQGEIAASWRRYVIKKGGVLGLSLGPYARPLLPGTYNVQLLVLRKKQDITLHDFFSKFNRDIEVNYRWAFRTGTEPESRADFKKKLTKLVEEAVATMDEAIAVGNDYRNKKRFRRGGRFDKVKFLKWANSMGQKLAKYDRETAIMNNSHLAPYWPMASNFDMGNLLLYLRLTVIDYMIYSVHMREGMRVPRQFEQKKGAVFKPSRQASIEKVQEMGREILRAISEDPPIDLLTLLPPEAQRPAAFKLTELTGPLATLFKTNPGSNTKISKTDAKILSARLGLDIEWDHIQSIALLSMTPEEGKGETVECYLVHLKRELSATMLVQRAQKQRDDGKFLGRVMQNETLVALILGPPKPKTKPVHRSAMGKIVRYLANQSQFKEVVK